MDSMDLDSSQEYLDAMAPPTGMEYRKPAVLPNELFTHAGIFFEEKLYTTGLSLLLNTLASGTYASNKAIIPVPQHIALCVTFLVHPSTTTRARVAEEQNASNLALRLLRLLATLVNPEDCRLGDAFKFAERASRSGRLHETNDHEGGRPTDKPLGLPMGTDDSLWSRAEDFWHAVGWAFNCSVLYPERWERWQIWLQYMCDIMQDDWTARVEKCDKRKEARNNETESNGQENTRDKKNKCEKEDLDIFCESLIFQFIASGSLSGRNRRVLRAIFADGGVKSVNEFGQVFKNELKSSRTPEQAKKRDREVNIEMEEYGDYLAQDESDEELNGVNDSASNRDSSSKPRKSKRTRRGTRSAGKGTTSQPTNEETSLPHSEVGLAPMGGLGALKLRKQLLAILSNVSERLPYQFMQWYDLYDLFVENISQLSLPIFQAIVSPAILPVLSAAAQTTLCEKLLFLLRESSARSSDEEFLTQSKLEECFLPYAAASNTAVNHIKISILLESVIMLLASSELIVMRPSFKEAVVSGINHRADRAQDEFRRNQASRDNEPLEWCWLVESGERLMYLVEILSLNEPNSS
ncbi:uncharacterized protein N7483_004383 [Penicillium malachiteum]|uniref:uncharacterized protein n=1 Tax=Penicillium malachiteum TaxID=1324776 RepID=UPI0025493925|nr:uncharacterized protein N7483_004383 [Penicillium malachiteum]KAJ5729875.1 hypothetical protein N7483_004383 [Penicillium malachiteum]